MSDQIVLITPAKAAELAVDSRSGGRYLAFTSEKVARTEGRILPTPHPHHVLCTVDFSLTGSLIGIEVLSTADHISPGEILKLAGVVAPNLLLEEVDFYYSS